MNAINTSIEKNSLSEIFFNSLFYTIPVGLFLVSFNCMFEMVRSHYFDWWYVIIPTIAVFALGNLYKLFLAYQSNDVFGKRKDAYNFKQGRFAMSNSNLATS